MNHVDAAVAAIFALLAVRTSGVYFLLLTLALGMYLGHLRALDRGHGRREWASRRHPPRNPQRGPQFLLAGAGGRGAGVLRDVAIRPLAFRPHDARHSR
jgi:hypothetical protein